MQKDEKVVQKNLLTLEGDGPIQMGFWIPNRVWATANYLIPLRDEILDKKKKDALKPMNPVIKEFKNWILSQSVYRMWVNSMIEQANEFVKGLDKKIKDEIKNDGDALVIPSFDCFFEILNEIISTSPSFNTTVMVGTPLNGLLAVSMATQAGLALFHDTTFNEHFRKVLNEWNRFLKSEASLDKLDIKDPEKNGSWISKVAHQQGVWKQMIHHADKPGYGFDSWNAFFIRRFVDGVRPFHGDEKSVINIGCETTPWEYQNHLAVKTNFWVKDVNYSLLDIFGGHEEYAKLFEGGQIYQGFLSATHYHRWNAPLTGNLIHSWVQPGTYFAQRPAQGEDSGTWEGTQSQPYLGHVAARAIFIFKHDTCGYIGLVMIGMVEVSTCVIKEGFLIGKDHKEKHVHRGVEIGHFEFGGSTHMMIFQKDKVRLEKWAIDAEKHQNDPNPTPMGTIIACATNTSTERLE